MKTLENCDGHFLLFSDILYRRKRWIEKITISLIAKNKKSTVYLWRVTNRLTTYFLNDKKPHTDMRAHSLIRLSFYICDCAKKRHLCKLTNMLQISHSVMTHDAVLRANASTTSSTLSLQKTVGKLDHEHARHPLFPWLSVFRWFPALSGTPSTVSMRTGVSLSECVAPLPLQRRHQVWNLFTEVCTHTYSAC